MYLRLLYSAFLSMFLRDFPFRSKCGVISLLTDTVDLLIIKENTQIYWMEVFLSFGAVWISCFMPLWHLFRLIRLKLNCTISRSTDWILTVKTGPVNFFFRDFMLMLSICSNCRMFAVYHGHENLIGPRLYKAVRCCLPVSIIMASCSCFKLSCFVASTFEVMRS